MPDFVGLHEPKILNFLSEKDKPAGLDLKSGTGK